MIRVREPRASQARQEAPPQRQQPPQEQPQPQAQQQDFPSNFYTHFDTSMSMIYRRLDQQQEESRKSFEAINARMDRMDDQLSFLCYSNQMVNETMYFPYQNTARQFKEMETQGIPVTIANLAIHRHREEEMNQERMRHNQRVQEAAAARAREANKSKAREVVPNSEEESEELASSASEEWHHNVIRGKARRNHSNLAVNPRCAWKGGVMRKLIGKLAQLGQRAHVICELSHVVRELWRPRSKIEAVTPRYA
ncbi:hypothetical protein PIB30_019594 [Stylosanthes scabra]|uniref:Uncharacterized protein n=1 Tax=Stylosanthes scabra TaxID=79078 RepID=A0ABU6Z5U8_9FABA|nr:hypothetical protein [Stylosanthes scabra]